MCPDRVAVGERPRISSLQTRASDVRQIPSALRDIFSKTLVYKRLQYNQDQINTEMEIILFPTRKGLSMGGGGIPDPRVACRV